MTETEAHEAKAAPDPGSEAERPPGEKGAKQKTSAKPARSPPPARWPLRGRDLLAGEVVVGTVLAVGLVAAVIVGTQTDQAWPWFVVALLAAAAIVAFVLFTRAHAALPPLERRTVPGRPRETVDPAEQKERAEVAPFSVRTSLYSRHLLRLLDRSRPHGQVVIPVSRGHRAQVLVEARSEHPVDIQDIRPVVTERQPTRHGEPVVAAEGALPQQHFDLALDEDPRASSRWRIGRGSRPASPCRSCPTGWT